MLTEKRFGIAAGHFFLGSLLALGLVYGVGWLSEVQSVRAKRVGALPPPVGRPGLIYGARVGWDGSRFLRRNTGIEKYSAAGELRWSVALDGADGRPAVSINSFHPAPSGEVLALGLEPGVEPVMVLYAISPDGRGISEVGRYPGMEPIDMTVQSDGRNFLLATEIQALNSLLCGHVAGPVEVEVNRLHELGPDGGIVRSFHPLRATVRDAKEAGEIIDRMDQYRLASDRRGGLVLYGRENHDLIRIDSRSGRARTTHLPQAGFPHLARIENLSFTDAGELVYTLVEFDADSALSGCQTWQADLEKGDFRLLARRTGNDEVYTVHWDASGRQLVVFDILGLGERGFQARSYNPLGDSRQEGDDLFNLVESLR